MDFINKKPVWFHYVLILAGTCLMALAIKSIYDPINMVIGGFTGIAVIVKSSSAPFVEGGIPLGLTNFVLNIPVFLLALKVKGFRFLGRSLLATLSLSFWLSVLPVLSLVSEDLILSSIFGGAITGVGIGMVFVAQATTGGTDMVAALIQHYFRHYSVARIMQMIDAVVVVAGAFVFGISKALYAMIAIFVVSRISDGMIEGLKFSKIAYIITNRQSQVADAISQQLRRGATGIDARGMYSGDAKQLLFCVVSKKEIIQLKEIVTMNDPKAFVIVSDAREVLGEGFIEQKM